MVILLRARALTHTGQGFCTLNLWFAATVGTEGVEPRSLSMIWKQYLDTHPPTHTHTHTSGHPNKCCSANIAVESWCMIANTMIVVEKNGRHKHTHTHTHTHTHMRSRTHTCRHKQSTTSKVVSAVFCGRSAKQIVAVSGGCLQCCFVSSYITVLHFVWHYMVLRCAVLCCVL